MDLSKAVAVIAARYESPTACADALGIDRGYFWRMMKGEKNNPTQPMLDALGLVKSYDFAGLRELVSVSEFTSGNDSFVVSVRRMHRE